MITGLTLLVAVAGAGAPVQPVAALPAPASIRSARRWLSTRRGVNSMAVLDTRGRVHGLAAGRPYVSASVVKAMLLVASLRAAGNRRPTPSERALLEPMIRWSDNDRADAVYARVGDRGLSVVAKRAGMRAFTVAGYWASATITARDQAVFFRRTFRMVPARARPFARRVLSSVVPAQRWGFARAARANGFTTYFKGGWRSTARGRLVHEAAFFERGAKRRFSMAVLTDGNPSHEYGTATLRGVARRVFRPPGRAAGGHGRFSVEACRGEWWPVERDLGGSRAFDLTLGCPGLNPR